MTNNQSSSTSSSTEETSRHLASCDGLPRSIYRSMHDEAGERTLLALFFIPRCLRLCDVRAGVKCEVRCASLRGGKLRDTVGGRL